MRNGMLTRCLQAGFFDASAFRCILFRTLTISQRKQDTSTATKQIFNFGDWFFLIFLSAGDELQCVIYVRKNTNYTLLQVSLNPRNFHRIFNCKLVLLINQTTKLTLIRLANIMKDRPH